MCCKKCTLSGHTDYIKEFINFTVEYEAKLERDERELLFGCRMDRMEWKLENRRTTQELYQIFCGKNNTDSMED